MPWISTHHWFGSTTGSALGQRPSNSTGALRPHADSSSARLPPRFTPYAPRTVRPANPIQTVTHISVLGRRIPTLEHLGRHRERGDLEVFGRCESAPELGTWGVVERLVQPTGGSVESAG